MSRTTCVLYQRSQHRGSGGQEAQALSLPRQDGTMANSRSLEGSHSALRMSTRAEAQEQFSTEALPPLLLAPSTGFMVPES